MYWLPPKRVKQSGIATIMGPIAPAASKRSRRALRGSPQAVALSNMRPEPVKPLRATSTG